MGEKGEEIMWAIWLGFVALGVCAGFMAGVICERDRGKGDRHEDNRS